MHSAEVTIEGIHIHVKPEWEKGVQAGVAHLDSRHPGTIRRVAVRFRPIKPGHIGVHVLLDGRIDHAHFHVEREGENVVALLHESFAVAERSVAESRARETAVRGVPKVVDESAETEPLDPQVDVEAYFLQASKEAKPPAS